jgi:flagellar biogenesis protein FliO
MKDFLIVMGLILVLALIFISAWRVERWVNYSLNYRAQVEQTVRDLVKPEALK